MTDRFSFDRFVSVIRAKRLLFILVALVAFALAALFSSPLFMKPRYRSMAIVYPVNLTNYSIETRADQLLQLFESNSIRDSLIDRFRLMEHYGLDTNLYAGKNTLFNLFRERVEVSKTRYESVQVEITDEQPIMARNMVQAMLDQVNLLARRLQREKSEEVLIIAAHALDNARVKLDSLEARLSFLRSSSGLLVYETQTQELTKGYVRMLTRGGTQGQKEEVLRMMKELEVKGGEFKSLTDLGGMFRTQYNQALLDKERAVNDMTKELTYTNVVVYPEVPDKKVYPVRWLIVLFAVVSASMLCFILVIWREPSLLNGPRRI
jgi:capsule polysaccharide export protein KpsE/RkpR